ncbi:MAG: glycine--tRNA ligase subunit beta [Thermoleophilia bacterium]
MTADRAKTAAAQDFLFEIGTEELPAAAARSAAAQVPSLALSALATRNLPVDAGAVSVWVTPRRIAVYVGSLVAMQPDQEIAARGPVASRAFEADGKPTKAAAGFAKAKGIAPEALEVREHEGQEFVFAVSQQAGVPTIELLPDICREILAGINVSRPMKWDDSGMKFARPIRWLVTKFGAETVDFELAGLRSGDTSRGHRFLGQPLVVIDDAADYPELMAAARVMVDQEQRRELILSGLANAAACRSAAYIDPAAELEEIIYLVENPSVNAGVFNEKHLRLPDRVLTTCMQSHQRYFPLVDGTGFLLAGFLYVMNGDPAASGAITEGNERVLEGRIEDAEFSYDQDLKTGIEAMASKLSGVVFHHKLGSLADKTDRLQSLVRKIGELVTLDGAEIETAVAAARLAKADLVSIMVQEFSDLEGHIGAIYAGMEGVRSDVCTAIEEHYLPVSAGGALPGSLPAAVLAIADKVDSLVGAFSVDEVPTGSRDPYGLRRAALGLAEITASFGFDFDLESLLSAAHNLFIAQKFDISRDAEVVRLAFEFVCDRVQQRQVERGMPVEIVEAARLSGARGTLRLLLLAQALDEFRADPKFEDLHTAYFRSSKIAAKAGEAAADVVVDESLFESDAERDLLLALDRLEPQVLGLVADRDYAAALPLAAGIRLPVDAFFDAVMVMAENERVRANRLALVSRTARLLLNLGDPMRVAAAPARAQK